ncbi:hypothetical protein RIF29_05799 [Crotalaria pallida]|uniref:Uncharacterized protein n=1 Tax=Crotalaria pallida TaxID=3830 RepID=A0AAN9J523_CROPI
MQPPPGEFQGYKEWYYDDPEEDPNMDNREAVGVEGAAQVSAAATTTTLPPADIQAAPKVNQVSSSEPNLKQKGKRGIHTVSASTEASQQSSKTKRGKQTVAAVELRNSDLQVRPCTRLATKNQNLVLNEGIITAAEVAKGFASQPEDIARAGERERINALKKGESKSQHMYVCQGHNHTGRPS